MSPDLQGQKVLLLPLNFASFVVVKNSLTMIINCISYLISVFENLLKNCRSLEFALL